MNLAQICDAYRGRSDFRSATPRSAVWFHQEDGAEAVSRFAWQGLQVVRALQTALGVTVDGKWGARTNAALKVRMSTMGLPSSTLVDGRITREMLEAALMVTYTLGLALPMVGHPQARVRVPANAVLPLWNQAPPGPVTAPDAAETPLQADGTPSATAPAFRLPYGASALTQPLLGGPFYYALAGHIYRVVLDAAGAAVERRLATPAELAALPEGGAPRPPAPGQGSGSTATGSGSAPLPPAPDRDPSVPVAPASVPVAAPGEPESPVEDGTSRDEAAYGSGAVNRQTSGGWTNYLLGGAVVLLGGAALAMLIGTLRIRPGEAPPAPAAPSPVLPSPGPAVLPARANPGHDRRRR